MNKDKTLILIIPISDIINRSWIYRKKDVNEIAYREGKKNCCINKEGGDTDK